METSGRVQAPAASLQRPLRALLVRLYRRCLPRACRRETRQQRFPGSRHPPRVLHAWRADLSEPRRLTLQRTRRAQRRARSPVHLRQPVVHSWNVLSEIFVEGHRTEDAAVLRKRGVRGQEPILATERSPLLLLQRRRVQEDGVGRWVVLTHARDQHHVTWYGNRNVERA